MKGKPQKRETQTNKEPQSKERRNMLSAFKDPVGRVCSNKSKPLWSHCGVCWDRDPLIISFCDHVFQILTEGQNTDEPTNVLNMRS